MIDKYKGERESDVDRRMHFHYYSKAESEHKELGQFI
jgi:hypothetical protein